MAFGIYKKGQGYWTRSMTAIAMGTLVLMGAIWLANILQNKRIANLDPAYTQVAVAVVVFSVFGWLGYLFIGRKPKSVDFLIATEGEMKKVNWSTRREIIGSTWIVIGLTAVVAVAIGVLDLGYSVIFRAFDVLESGG